VKDLLIIAEIGSVHDGSFGNACKLIELAAKCGANVAKFQTHIASAETLVNAPMPTYFKGEPRFEYFERTGFSREQWRKLREHCEAFGVKFLSSPFSLEAVDLLEEIGAEIYKVPSGEVTNLPLLSKLGSLGKPVLLSSGMSSWNEMDAAVGELVGKVPLNIMQCTSAYPCPPEKAGLNVLAELRDRYGSEIGLGFSDHTAGIAAGVAAAALGATAIEKHLTFSKAMYGSDAANAMEPGDFELYCGSVRDTWTMLRNPVNKNDVTAFGEMKQIFEKSIVAARPLAQGTIIEETHLAFKKPGDGVSAGRYREFIGRSLARPVATDEQFLETDFL
jgi:N-acetylneuraminate synthase